MRVINLRAKPLPELHCPGEEFAMEVAEWSVVTVSSRAGSGAGGKGWCKATPYSQNPGVKPLLCSVELTGSPSSYGAGLEPGRDSKSRLCKSS